MKRKGQATLEYAIILAVIIAAVVLVGRGVFRTQLETALNASANRIGTEALGLSK